MRLLIFFCTALLLSAAACSSQKTAAETTTTQEVPTARGDRPDAETRAERQATALTARLMLNEATSEEAEAILLKYAKRNEAVMQSGGDRRSKFGRLRENSDAQDREMRGVLNDEQYELYLELKAEQREQMRERMRNRRG